MSYPLGNSVRTIGTFRDEAGELMDPATVRVIIQRPDESETTYTYDVDAAVIRDSLGIYSYWIATPTAGTYRARWKGHNAAYDAANEADFEVDESEFANP